jgi:hypothetical protein
VKSSYVNEALCLINHIRHNYTNYDLVIGKTRHPRVQLLMKMALLEKIAELYPEVAETALEEKLAVSRSYQAVLMNLRRRGVRF